MTKQILITLWLGGLLAVSSRAAEDRIMAPVNPARTVSLPRHVHPRTRLSADLGPVDPEAPIEGVIALFKPAAGLDALLASQQIPGTPDYRRWLTPEEFGARFGASDGDLARVRGWIEAQGLRVNRIARGRMYIEFSGPAGRLGRALHTSFRHYEIGGRKHFANSSDPEIPEALAPLIAGFLGLNDIPHEASPVQPMPLANVTGGGHAVSPDDLAVIYNLNPLFATGIQGTNQKIAIVGDSGLDLTDVRLFRKTFNLPARDPQVVSVGRDPGVSSNNFEAIGDIEMSGAAAPNAQIVYVYSSSAFFAMVYAADNNLAPVISVSFGSCEAYTDLSVRAMAQQANAQGITIVAASGDWGPATCDQVAPTPQASRGVSQSFPASLPEVTAVGGTEFNEGGGRYWNTTQTLTLASATSYIPETVWNDNGRVTSLKIASGGGPGSFAKPWWQSAPGVPDDGARDVPDVSLSASYLHDGYLVVYQGALYSFGGTSAASPTFAGILALLNQSVAAHTGKPGLGNINPALYRLAQTAPDAFHDVTFGNNNVPCAQGSPGCVDGSLGFSAGPGYDLATGLGSVDAQRLFAAWNSGAASTTSVAADPPQAGIGDSVNLTATVAGSPGIAPTGSVTFLVFSGIDAAIGSAVLSPAGDSATATLKIDASRVLGGAGAVTALYSGDRFYAASSGAVKIAANPTGTGSMVVAFATPSPSAQEPAMRYWPVDFVLSERAGVATTITNFALNGSAQSLALFSSPAIPANGAVTAPLVISNLQPNTDLTAHFAGRDADGTAWSRDLTVHLMPAPAGLPLPGITLTGSPASVALNPQADAACQWSHQLVLHETGGYPFQMTSLRQNTSDISGNIQQLFGATRLAPFGTLTANVCAAGTAGAGARTFTVGGVTDVSSTTITASTSVSYTSAAASPALASVSPAAITLAPDTPSTLNLNFATGSPQWTASVLPAKPDWLTLSQTSGSGSAAISLTGSAGGLSRGAWTVTLAIQSSGATPQVISIPVTLVVGGSDAVSIGGVAHGASFATSFAPGMVLSVFGTNLAPAVQAASGLPLPLSLAGVSVTVNGISAPLYFVSQGQLNVQVPYETGAGPAVLAVNNNGQVAVFPFNASVTAPGIFTAADGSLAPNPSGARGAVLLAYITGDGDLTPTLATGATPSSTTALASLPRPRLPVTISVGGVNAAIAFAGVPPGLSGVTQINFTVPQEVAPGDQSVVVTVGGVASRAARLTVQ